MCLQAKAANTEASSVQQNGYLKAALQGTLDKATKVMAHYKTSALTSFAANNNLAAACAGRVYCHLVLL